MKDIRIKKRSGSLEQLDITKIQKMTAPATADLDGVNQSELEVDAHIKFVDGMSSSDVQQALIDCAVEKIDIDKPNWTFVAARLKLYDLYHNVGKALNTEKGKAYCHLQEYLDNGINKAQKLFPDLAEGYDIDDLNNYLEPERDLLFNYLGIKALVDRYLVKDQFGRTIELPQQLFMAVAMFLAKDEVNKQQCAKDFYDAISKHEVMLATPTLSNARTNRHQLSSCYINSTPDNIEGIFDGYKENSLLSKYGGGIGTDYTPVRAQGGEIDKNPKAAGGIVPFSKIMNDVAVAVDQLGKISAPSYRNVA